MHMNEHNKDVKSDFITKLKVSQDSSQYSKDFVI